MSEQQKGWLFGAAGFLAIILIFGILGNYQAADQPPTTTPFSNADWFLWGSFIVIAILVTYILRSHLPVSKDEDTTTDEHDEDDEHNEPQHELVPEVPLPATPSGELSRQLSAALRERDYARLEVQHLQERYQQIFGTADLEQVETAVKALYGELEERRAGEAGSLRLASQLEQKQADYQELQLSHLKMKARFDSSNALLESLHQMLLREEDDELLSLPALAQKYLAWEEVPDPDLESFFASVKLEDDAFLASRRRQRRLKQRLRAEGFRLVRPI